MRVYVAGPIGPRDGPLREENVRRGIAAGAKLAAAGLDPFVPHLLDAFAKHLPPDTLGYEDYMRIDFAWLSASDCMLRLPGESPGADREHDFAAERGIPVFDTIAKVIKWARK